MLTINEGSVIYVSLLPVDMRQGVNGLSALVANNLIGNLQSGDLFLFCSRDRSKIKALCWDKNGFILLYKRLEKEKFKFPIDAGIGHIEISSKELSWLLAGFNFSKMSAHPNLNFTDYF